MIESGSATAQPPIRPVTGNNIIAGNSIGTDVTGTVDLGNGWNGIKLLAGAQSNRIGTNGDGNLDDVEANIIAFNGQEGVAVAVTTRY